MMKFVMGAAASLAIGSAANAAVVVLDFNGVANPNNVATVGDYYNGGTSGDGNTGTNYGVAFTPNALAINSYNGCCSPDPGILYFLSGGAVNISYAAGFTTGFSFYYSSASTSSVTVYDGVGGTGNVLATINLVGQANSNCPPNSSGYYCTWTPIGVSFSGTAKSIDFAGAANFVAFDDITFGSAVAGGVPEPASWVMLIAGFGLVGAARRRKATVVTA
jgi:hypothetical protein